MCKAIIAGVTAALIVLGGAMAVAQSAAPKSDATASHPLCPKQTDICQFFATAGNGVGQAAAPVQAMVRAFGAHSILLLGEIHDNAIHHRVRAKIISHLVAANKAGGKPALVFEHLTIAQQPKVDAYLARVREIARGDRAEGFFKAVGWAKSGWPDSKIFEPLFTRALEAGHSIVAANVTRAYVRKIVRGGDTSLTDAVRQRLRLVQPLEADLKDALLEELERSHCGLMPKSAFTRMAQGQNLRDAHMASQVGAAANKHGSAVLLAGNGHVRADRGVPYYLRRMGHKTGVVTVMLLEVSSKKTKRIDYIERGPDGRPAVDFIILTRRAEREDPCERMRRYFKKKR